MKVKVYDVNGSAQKIFRAECDIAECFPSDPHGLQDAWNDIQTSGQCWIGGGAAPFVILERADER